jgi:hypothetical protein
VGVLKEIRKGHSESPERNKTSDARKQSHLDYEATLCGFKNSSSSTKGSSNLPLRKVPHCS